MAQNNGGAMMVGLLLGAAVGAGVALLFAPMAGDETRRRIGESARRLTDSARGTLDDARARLDEGIEQVEGAVEAGKEAFRQGEANSPMVQDRV